MGHTRGMELRETVSVRVPADQAWALVGEAFGAMGTWATPVVASTMDAPAAPGSVRTSHIRGFGPVAPGVIKERVARLDPAERSLSYEWVEGRPSFLVRAMNDWSVHGPESARDSPEPGGCTVRWHSSMTL